MSVSVMSLLLQLALSTTRDAEDNEVFNVIRGLTAPTTHKVDRGLTAPTTHQVDAKPLQGALTNSALTTTSQSTRSLAER